MPPEAVFAPLTTTIAFGKTARKELDCRRSARSRSSWCSSWRWWSSARASCPSSAGRSGAAIASSAGSSRASRPTSKARSTTTMTTMAPSPRTPPTTPPGRSKPVSPTTPRPPSRRRPTPPRNRIRGNHRERRPKALEFLLDIGGSQLRPELTADKYLGLVSLMIVAFGIAFEFPVVLVFLLLARVLTTQQLRKWRRPAILIIVIFAAVITPSQDPYSLFFMAVPMYIFYEMSIILGRILKR